MFASTPWSIVQTSVFVDSNFQTQADVLPTDSNDQRHHNIQAK
jgi:hypothetical protein